MEKRTTISNRISMLVKEFSDGVNSQFAKAIGVNESNIRSYIAGTQPKFEVLSSIAEKFAINCEWLLTGEGDMMKHVHERQSDCPVAIPTNNPKEGIPLIPLGAMAGSLTSEQTVLDYECDRYVVPAFKGADYLIQVKGTSMIPTYHSGDIVACQNVPLNNLFFQWNKPYVLDTNQGPLIKRVKPGSDADHIRIISDNKEYDPFELSRSDINAVALVVGLIRLE